MGDYASIVPVLASLVSTGTQAYSLAQAASAPSAASFKLPTPQPQDTTQMNRALLPEARANAATNLGGGFSPEFLAGLIGNESGSPQGALDILGDIRKGLNVPQATQAV